MSSAGLPDGAKKKSSPAATPNRSPLRAVGRGGRMPTGGGKVKKRAKLEGEGAMWIDMARRYWEREAKRSKDTVLSFAAESAFVKQAQFMQRPTTLNRRDLHITVVPRQWLHDQLVTITLIACQIPELPKKFGLWIPNVEQLFLDHNRLRELPDSLIFAEQ